METESLRKVAQARAPLSAWFGILLLFMLFGAIVLALLGPSAGADNHAQKAKKRVDLLKTLHEEDAKALTAYGWIDKAKGSARIPIDHAMQLMAVELAQKKPAPAYPIATPAPPPAAAPSPAAPGAKAPASPAATPAPPAAASPSPATGQPKSTS
ncbi:MAG TPA: hypothetical protein VGG94_03745 [Chthoniobacterales bacterium]